MLRINFSPAEEARGFVSTILSLIGPFEPPRVFETRTLAECEAAFAKACEHAATISVSRVREAFGNMAHADAKPVVMVSAYWIGPARKPNGFKAKRWTAHITPKEA